MDHNNRRASGQALIEATLSITLIMIIICCGLGIAVQLSKAFKHDYLESPATVKTVTPNMPFLKQFPTSNTLKNVKSLKDDDWSEESEFKAAGQLFVLMSKNGKHILVSKNIGVLE